ncbi:hypothetical protein B0T21DRAFT_369235 [Apiosordaria backusii]|uniref:Uncharacterized protein n=1 Tax=Apiosordaria backusii TaxID=314023 RepID=A0AA40EA95_9PEZI|nr:hypothetical protein B0T21DRAFT_369235 [Apiosordaria backusii]
MRLHGPLLGGLTGLAGLVDVSYSQIHHIIPFLRPKPLGVGSASYLPLDGWMGFNKLEAMMTETMTARPAQQQQPNTSSVILPRWRCLRWMETTCNLSIMSRPPVVGAQRDGMREAVLNP